MRASKALPCPRGVHRVVSNLKTWLQGTHHGVGADHLELLPAADLLANRHPAGILWPMAALVLQPLLFSGRARRSIGWLRARLRAQPAMTDG